MVVFNYNIFPETRQRLRENNIKMHYLASWQDVYDEIRENSAFDNATIRQIKKFIDNPIRWSDERKNGL